MVNHQGFKYTNSNHENMDIFCENASKIFLEKMANKWRQRTAVRSQRDLSDFGFDKNKDDFLLDLIPFANHPDFLNLPYENKQKILTYGWLIYSAKTIVIETEIVTPTCLSILAEKISGITDDLSKKLASETMVDESYHIYMCLYGMELTKKIRGIDFKIPTFSFVNNMKKLQNKYTESWKKDIIQFVTSIVTEIYITDYLDLINENNALQIQEVNRLIVKTHRFDELSHGKIFSHLAKLAFCKLTNEQKEFFSEILPMPIQWLSDLELDTWKSVLQYLGIRNSQEIIGDTRKLNSKSSQPACCDNSGIEDLIKLAGEIGVLDLAIGRKSFEKAGIIVN